MPNIPIYFVIAYCVVAISADYHYNQLTSNRYYRIHSIPLRIFVAIIAVGTILFQYGFAMHYGHRTRWYYGLILLLIGLASEYVWDELEMKVFHEKYAGPLFLWSLLVSPVRTWLIISHSIG
jgi:hypothetical protein